MELSNTYSYRGRRFSRWRFHFEKPSAAPAIARSLHISSAGIARYGMFARYSGLGRRAIWRNGEEKTPGERESGTQVYAAGFRIEIIGEEPYRKPVSWARRLLHHSTWSGLPLPRRHCSLTTFYVANIRAQFPERWPPPPPSSATSAIT